MDNSAINATNSKLLSNNPMSYDIVEEDASAEEKKVLINEKPIGSKKIDFGERISVNNPPNDGDFVVAKTPFTPKN